MKTNEPMPRVELGTKEAFQDYCVFSNLIDNFSEAVY